MSSRYAADTMALILYLEKRKLPKKVYDIFTQIEQGVCHLMILAMVVAEIGYLAEKKRIDTNITEVQALVARLNNISIHAMDEKVVSTAFQLTGIPELHDRLIAATAIACQAILITNDPLITNSKVVDVLW